jgi:hypothetical protein
MEKLIDCNIKLNLKVKCKEGEETEVKQRLLNLIISAVKHMEGLFTTGWPPWKKTYYFSVREVTGEVN